MKKLLILLILLLTGCSNKYYSKNFFYMDTVINIKLYDISEKKANEAFEEIDDLYSKYENITNFYSENSELYNLNNTNTEEYIKISNELYELIEIGLDWYNKSNGLLNINIGSLTQIWHDFRNQSISFPTLEQLNNIDISIDKIKLKDNKILNSDFKIDLGSITKGYVTEKAGVYLENKGINYYIINAGGNVKVGKSDKGYYNIGIASPINSNEIFYSIKDENISVVTSGGYERFYEYNDTLYHHIINPNTRYPANYMKSVTIIGKNSGICDALSTILFLMDIDSGKEFIKDFDVSVIWFSNENEVIKSENFKY